MLIDFVSVINAVAALQAREFSAPSPEVLVGARFSSAKVRTMEKITKKIFKVGKCFYLCSQ